MPFPDEEAKLSSGRISNAERLAILIRLGELAQQKYDEFVIQGGNSKGYSLGPLTGSLQYVPNIATFENEYYLEGRDEHWTNIAYFFEYGTGLHNVTRASEARAYIKPTESSYLKFVTKQGKWVTTKQVEGVYPVFAMTKAVKYIEFNRARIQREIRLELQQDTENV